MTQVICTPPFSCLWDLRYSMPKTFACEKSLVSNLYIELYQMTTFLCGNLNHSKHVTWSIEVFNAHVKPEETKIHSNLCVGYCQATGPTTQLWILHSTCTNRFELEYFPSMQFGKRSGYARLRHCHGVMLLASERSERDTLRYNAIEILVYGFI